MMYTGKSEPIPLPTTGHLHTLKTGYVYWDDGVIWDNEKKQTVDGRISNDVLARIETGLDDMSAIVS